MALPASRRNLLSTFQQIYWTEDGEPRSARWHSERAAPPPQQVQLVDDRLSADAAYGLACQGVGLLWRSDFQNARHMLVALGKRADRRRKGPARGATAPSTETSPSAVSMTAAEVRTEAASEAATQAATQAASQAASQEACAAAFHLERQARAQRARTLGALLIELDADYRSALRRAPDVQLACSEALGPGQGPLVLSLRELQGIIGAHEWRVRGIDLSRDELPVAESSSYKFPGVEVPRVEFPGTELRIHPHYGVFAPVRHEYVSLVAQTPLPTALASHDLAFDIGTGTGVLAAVLARRGVGQVIATDLEPRALVCANDNIERLGLAGKVSVQQADLFPPGRAALIVCNPPWLPGRASSALERAVYDPDSSMLLGFLRGLAEHLVPEGEGWLILSDLAEHLGLRSRKQLLSAIAATGLQVLGRIDARPTHPRATDTTDPLHAARMAEVTSLWRLGVMGQSALSCF